MTESSCNILLFGQPEVRQNHERVRLATKQVALLTRVYADPGHSISRARLAALLWPESDLPDGRHSLSQALYVIKKKLGASVLRTTPEEIGRGDAWCDVDEFIGAVGSAELAYAASLYRDSFAKDLSVPSSAAFDHWVDERRTDLVQSAEHTASGLAAKGMWKEASDLSSSILQGHPSNLSAARVKTSALLAIANPQEAKSFAESQDAAVRDEALKAIANHQSPSRHSGEHFPDNPFVGRSDAMAWLQDQKQKAEHREPRVAVVEGEAGVGKTSLLRRFCRLMALRGARVLMAKAYAAETNLPFGVVGQWLQDLSERDLPSPVDTPWMSAVAKFFPTLTSEAVTPDTGVPSGEAGQQRLLESLRRLFVGVSQRHPLVLAIDDIHWTDPASLSFLHYLLRRGEEATLFAVATIRSGQARPHAISEWVSASTYSLTGLDSLEIAELLNATYESPSESDPEAIEHLLQQTGGNPLLLSIVLREGTWRPGESVGPPQSIIDFLKPRLLERSAEARRILGALWIMGEPTRPTTLRQLVGASQADLQRALDELEHSRLITTKEGGIALQHGLAGEVALSIQPIDEKQRVHGRAARLLAKDGGLRSPVAAVSHDLAGNQTEAFDASVRASEACDVLHARAEKEFFLKLALSNAPSARDEAQIRLELADLQFKQGNLEDALEALDLETIPAAPEDITRVAEVMRLRALAEMTGEVEVLEDLWTQAKKAGDDLPAHVVVETYSHIGTVAYDLGLDHIAEQVAELAEERLGQAPADDKTAHLMLRLTAVFGLLRGYQGALNELSRLPAPGELDALYAIKFRVTRATLLVAAGELQEAEELFVDSLVAVERYALFDNLFSINNNLGVCLMEQARYDEAERCFTEAMKHAAEISPSQYSTAQDNLNTLAYERGAYQSALEMATQSLSSQDVYGRRAVMSLWAILGLSALELGNLAQCREAEREIQVLVRRYGAFRNDISYVHVFLARMQSLRKEHNAALEGLSRAAKHYRPRNRLAYHRMILERCRLEIRLGRKPVELLREVFGELNDTGAYALIEKTHSLATRLGL